MTRDAEHTQTGYEDAASVVVNQASAPSSLAGGEVAMDRDTLIALIMEETTDDIVADGWDRLGKPNVLVQGCRYIRRNAPASPEGYANPEASAKQFAGFIADRILAALSPEAPAREGVDWQPIETALQDGTKIDLWGYWPEHDRWVRTPDAVWDAERCDWKVNGFYAGAYVHPPRFTHWRAITGPAALTPRHEAPAEGTVSSEAELKRIVKDMITHRRAGDDLMADDVANCLWPLLRVHSSAPEAREGEAWRVERTEYAVKFWVGVQGFTVATRGDDPDGGEHLRLMEKMLRRALGRISAALKAEDAK